MSRKLGQALNGVTEPHRKETHIGRISTVGDGGRSLSVDNMNNSQLRNLVPIMPYGISSSPPIGLMSFVLAANNSGRDGIIGVYDPNKPSCNSGECMMYSSGGATIHCKGKNVLLNGTTLVNNRHILNENDELFRRVVNLENRVTDLEDRVNNLETEVSNLKNRVSILESKI